MDLTVFTQPMIDVLVHCDIKTLDSLKLPLGSHAHTSRSEHRRLLGVASQFSPRKISGGSGANTAVCARLLGLKTQCLGLAADDEHGKLFDHSLVRAGVEFPIPLLPVEAADTGTCISFITKDTLKGSERTMRTHVGVAGEFVYSKMVRELINQTTWILLEGYYLSTNDTSRRMLEDVLSDAQCLKKKIVLSIAAEFVAECYREKILSEILPRVEMVYANEPEAKALTQCGNSQEAFESLSKRVSHCIVTCGAKGAWIAHRSGKKQIQFFVPAYTDIVAVDPTGAGDAFIGAYLSGLIRGYSPQQSARGAARIAAAVVAQEGARLPLSAVQLWRQAIENNNQEKIS